MSDKFVVSTNEIGEIIVTDVETGNVYRYDDPSNFFGLIRLLNEQQALINELKERNAHNFAQNIQLKKEIKELKEEEKLYAKEIVRLNKNIEELNKTIEEALKFKSLGGDY